MNIKSFSLRIRKPTWKEKEKYGQGTRHVLVCGLGVEGEQITFFKHYTNGTDGGGLSFNGLLLGIENMLGELRKEQSRVESDINK